MTVKPEKKDPEKVPLRKSVRKMAEKMLGGQKMLDPDDPKSSPTPAEGKDAGELEKRWEDTFK